MVSDRNYSIVRAVGVRTPVARFSCVRPIDQQASYDGHVIFTGGPEIVVIESELSASHQTSMMVYLYDSSV